MVKTTGSKVKSFGGLMITRKVGDIIIFNHGEILIQITRTKGNEVRLCIKADPKKVYVRRFETTGLDLESILAKLNQEGEEACSGNKKPT